MAFHNAANYAFLGAAAAFTAWQWPAFGWVPIAVAGGIEAFWLLVGARVGGAKRYFNFVHREKQKQLAAGDSKALLRGLTDTDRTRFAELDRLNQEIQAQVRANPSMAMDLVKGELEKIDKLLEAFLRLAGTAARYEHYVETSDLNQIESEVRRQEKVIEKSDDDTRGLAKKNLDLLIRRQDKAIEIRKQVREARGQLNLIENTFRLLRDQILTMDSPSELQSQLSELTAAVDSIEAADKETDALVRQLDREIAGLRN